MQHYHITDISHGHTAGDHGHSHDFGGGNASQNNDQYAVMMTGGVYIGSPTSDWGWHKAVLNAEASVYVNDYSGSKWSSGSCQDGSGTPKILTDSNDVNAGETRPTNFTVKIWKRTA